MRFFVAEKLGPKQSLTPEGFLLCADVPIARTGVMLYGPDETPIKSDDPVLVARDEEDVFRDETIASFHGKPVTFDHPPEDVTPGNWKTYAAGTVLNPRRGKGGESDLLLADLLIADPDAIKAIRDGDIREVSCGYEADYLETGDGNGRQTNIVGNHVALVEQGRCGSRCAIGDKSFTGDKQMSKQQSWLDRVLLRAFKAKDEAELKQIKDEAEESAKGEGNTTHVHVYANGEPKPEEKKAEDAEEKEDEDPIEKRFKGLESKMAEIGDALSALVKGGSSDAEDKEDEKEKKADDAAEEKEKADDADMEEEYPEGEAEDAKKSKDSAYLESSFDETKSLAEIIAPGVRIPTFDRAADKKKSFTDCICGLRRKALQAGSSDAATAAIITQVRGRSTDASAFAKMPCGEVRSTFRAVAALKKASNNDSAFAGAGSLPATATTLTAGQRIDEAVKNYWK